MLTVGSLFAGYGGIEMGLASVLDCEPAWFAEFEAAPSKVLAHHWPDVPNYGDVTKVDWAAVPKVDIITGGSPCQDLSHAGKRAGMKAGTRSGLWASMCDAIDIIRPRLVVWENVRGALSAEADSELEHCPGCMGDGDGRPVLRALGRVLGDLADLGYDASWYGLRAADVGAAHGRFRIFLFATPVGDARGLGGLEAVQHDGRGTTSGDRGSVPDQPDSDALRDGPNGGGHVPGQLTLLSTPQARDYKGLPADGYNTACLVRDVEKLLPTPAVNDMGACHTPDTWDEWTAKMQAAHGNGNGHGKSLAVEAQRLLPTPTSSIDSGGLDESGEKYGPTSGVTLTDAAIRQDWREYEPAIRRQEWAFGRPAPLPTEPGKSGKPRLSPMFVEWLMGVPEGHVTDPAIGLTRNEQLKALGNGVVPQQCAAAARAFLTDTAKETAA